jgi:uncharacterized protein YecE (DUF72 family)
MVELNFSYYAMPKTAQLQRMVDRTPQGFLFAIKGHKTLTHERDQGVAQAAEFREALTPLQAAGRLGAVLLQFPYSFHYERPTRTYLDRLCSALEGLPLAVEFRNDEWQRDSVTEGLEARGVAVVNVDAPQLPRLPEPSSRVTAPLAYVRLHGRNRESWWEGDNTTRYDYLYGEGELQDWAARIRTILRKARTLLVAFNNHFRGQAVQNARMLKGILAQEATFEVR